MCEIALILIMLLAIMAGVALGYGIAVHDQYDNDNKPKQD